MKKGFVFTFINLYLLIACEEEPTDPCTGDFTISATEVINASCGQANGSIRLSATAAQGDVTYRLSDGTLANNNLFEGLSPGVYEISAEDGQGCTTSVRLTVENEEVEITAQISTTASECNTSEGTISLAAAGGTAPYRYSLDGQNFQTESQFTKVEPGQYMVTIEDANGCQSTIGARVSSGISYSARISDIISANCAVTGCHVAGTGRINFSEKSTILSNAAAIKNRTGNDSMPPGNRSLTDAQIAEIACWVDDGAPDN